MTPKQAMRKVTQQFADEGVTPYNINDGECDAWAQEVMDLLEDSKHEVEIWETVFCFADTTHVFLRVDGKFYDAECLQGADDHMELPIFANLLEECGRQSVWMTDCNEAAKPVENRRDLTYEQVLEYNKENGIDWISEQDYQKQEAELAANRHAKSLNCTKV